MNFADGFSSGMWMSAYRRGCVERAFVANDTFAILRSDSEAPAAVAVVCGAGLKASCSAGACFRVVTRSTTASSPGSREAPGRSCSCSLRTPPALQDSTRQTRTQVHTTASPPPS
jgi:hypothetical protein